jgi:hypothetical protein
VRGRKSTTTLPDREGARRLRVQLVSALADGGGLSSPLWRRLFDRVRREPFVPRFWRDTDGAGAFFDERRSRPSIRYTQDSSHGWERGWGFLRG